MYYLIKTDHGQPSVMAKFRSLKQARAYMFRLYKNMLDCKIPIIVDEDSFECIYLPKRYEITKVIPHL